MRVTRAKLTKAIKIGGVLCLIVFLWLLFTINVKDLFWPDPQHPSPWVVPSETTKDMDE